MKYIDRKVLKRYRDKNKRRRVKAEQLLKKALLDNRIHFCHQQIVRNYIVDFAIQDRNVLIEIDGWSHNKTVEKDTIREKELRDFGFEFIRFKNELVYKDVITCIECIKTYPINRTKEFYCNLGLANTNPFKVRQKIKVMKKKKTIYSSSNVCGHGRVGKWCTVCRYSQ